MNNPLAKFLLVLTFFTRLPLPESLGKRIGDDSNLAGAVAFFPIVGLLIGAATAIVWAFATLVLPASVSAGLAIATGLLLTGALHEDGLADCADGLGGSADRDKALEIMRDSRIGTYGGVALIMSVGLRWACLATLSPAAGISALIIAHTASRSAMPIAMKLSRYARAEGLGKMASDDLPETGFFIAMLIAIISGMIFAGLHGLIAVLFALALAWCFLKVLEARLGGYTGDGLGAMQQVAEISTLIVLAGSQI